MKRIPASQRMRKELEELLEGINKGEFLLSELIKKGAALGSIQNGYSQECSSDGHASFTGFSCRSRSREVLLKVYEVCCFLSFKVHSC